MITVRRIFAAASMALCMTAFNACVKEEAPEQLPVADENLVEITFEASSVGTKSTFDGDARKINWELTDKVAVYDGTAKRQFSVTAITDGVATLKGYVADDATEFYAVYPYSAAGDDLPVEGAINITVPQEQTLAEGKNFDEDAFVTVGKVENDNIAFKNVVSLLKLNIPADVTSVKVMSYSEEKFAGAATAKTDDRRTTTAGNAASVVLKPSAATFAEGEHYIALLPTTFEKGFRVVYEQASQIGVSKTSAEVVFPVNGGFSITGSTPSWIPTVIMNETQLRNYFANQDLFGATEVKLGQNIALTSAWTPVTLTGKLDGKNHTISGVNVSAKYNAGFFAAVKTGASVKNLTIEGTIKALKPTSAAKTYVGVAGTVSGTMENVTNEANITLEDGIEYQALVGGITGNVLSGGVVKKCVNNGSITVDGTGKETWYVGGIAGYVGDPSGAGWSNNAAGTVDQCINEGALTVNNARVEAIGGVVGMFRGGSISACENKGSITATKTLDNGHLGGIVGYVQNRSGAVAKVNACENNGTVQSNATTVWGIGGVVGHLQMNQNANTEITGCYNKKAIKVTTSRANGSLGGIVGIMSYDTGSYAAIISSCHNEADLSFDYSSLTAGKLGGIAGYTTCNVVIENCDNSAKCTIIGSKSAGNTSHVGGIVGRSDVKVSMTGNANKAGGDVRLEVKSRDKYQETCTAGGILGLSQCGSGCTMSNNTNRATVTSASLGKQIMAGGIVGSVDRSLTMSDNINFGDVTMTDGTADNFAGGIVGAFNMASTSGASVSLLRDKSFGAISSSARAGLLFGAYVSNCYVNTTINDCVVGGSRQGTPITAGNFADNLWSYTRDGSEGTTLFHKNTTYGEASAYDTPTL